MRCRAIGSRVRGRLGSLAMGLAITCFGLGCTGESEESTEDVLGRDTTLARSLAMANTPGADGLSEAELAAIVANQPPLPSWVAVATQLDRKPPRQAQPAAASPRRTDQPAVAAPARGQDRPEQRDTLREPRAESDTGPERIGAGIGSPEAADTSSRVVVAGPAPASRRATETRTTACESPALEAQRSCLVALLAEHDAPVNSAYRARIDRLRQQAGVQPGDPDPPSVRELREIQIRWLIFRDRECRRRTAATAGTLWAPPRADCLGLFSTARTWELSQG